jgi:xylulokinase
MEATGRTREALLLGIDVGTTGAKAALFDLNGRLESMGQAEYEVQHIRPAWVEQRPEDWWQAMVTATSRLWRRGAAAPERVVGNGQSSQWGGTVAVDATGQPQRPALTWMDSRGAPDSQALMDGMPSVDGYGVLKALRWLRFAGGVPSLSG